MRPDDTLKYAAALVRERLSWVGDSLCALTADIYDEQFNEELEFYLDQLWNVGIELVNFAAQFGDPRQYADGRVVSTDKEVELGFVVGHIWHPDPDKEHRLQLTGPLSSFDPDKPSPGVYEVNLRPWTQEILVRVARIELPPLLQDGDR